MSTLHSFLWWILFTECPSKVFISSQTAQLQYTPCPFTWNFITSPISLEKTTSNQNPQPFVGAMGQDSLALWGNLCHHTLQVRAHQLLPACEEDGHQGFTGSLPHCYSPGARAVWAGGTTAEMSCLSETGCARASTLDARTTNTCSAGGWVLHVTIPVIHSLCTRGLSGITALMFPKAALLAPLQNRTSTTSTGSFFALPFRFLWVLTQPYIMSTLISYLLLPVCIYTAETSGGAKFPYIIFLHSFQVWAMY